MPPEGGSVRKRAHTPVATTVIPPLPECAFGVVPLSVHKCFLSVAHISSAARTRLSKTCWSNGFTRNSAAPSLIACIRTLASPCAVMKMIGVFSRSALSLACSSRPDIPGIRISSIRHAALCCRPDSRNSFADPKHRAESPSASIRSWSALWTDSSSSTITMNLVPRPPAMRPP
jgi:hypothetical protein